MIAKEECMEIRILSKQGKSIREIHRITGHSRNTIRKFLRSAAMPTYKKRGPRPGKLDPFKTFLEERQKAAAPHRLPATVLAREIRELGYDGSERMVRLFLAALAPVKELEPVVRFETEPGRQMQADWVELRMERRRFSWTLIWGNVPVSKEINNDQTEPERNRHRTVGRGAALECRPQA
ncbi:hypothetical protein SAMN05661003_1182 [Desulfuromonas thiophila]|uniref:HTH IS21-type domain-containing protein n=1 Tax=Desulfuromonas thiophila TaxID=57664 RepID=A0A1G7E5I2_9BACT|nr:hypothetical protein SAMN05661003_1182 [Desulfuromonas thiophila]